jgi:hypothetical protein
MEIVMPIKDYNPVNGIQLTWEFGFTIYCIKSKYDDNSFIIKANDAGLISLANHLLTLAQKGVPSGSHIHLDDDNGLENGSCKITFEKNNEIN